MDFYITFILIQMIIFGHLDTIHMVPVVSIEKLTQINYFKQNKIKIKKTYASVSGFCTFWLSDKNRLYANGRNDKGPFVISNDTTDEICEPILIPDLYNVII